MDALLSVLPNLSIGVVSVLALAYYALKSNERDERKHREFIQHLQASADKHEKAMFERENAMRSLETSVRNNMTEQMTKNTVALIDVAKVLGRVVRHLDGEK